MSENRRSDNTDSTVLTNSTRARCVDRFAFTSRPLRSCSIKYFMEFRHYWPRFRADNKTMGGYSACYRKRTGQCDNTVRPTVQVLGSGQYSNYPITPTIKLFPEFYTSSAYKAGPLEWPVLLNIKEKCADPFPCKCKRNYDKYQRKNAGH
jgi:hypothetical protein